MPPPDSAENAAPGSGAYASNAPSGYQPAQQSANEAAQQSGDQPVAVSGGQTSPADVRCVMIAVCCHHRVDWASYVGKHFLQVRPGRALGTRTVIPRARCPLTGAITFVDRSLMAGRPFVPCDFTDL